MNLKHSNNQYAGFLYFCEKRFLYRVKGVGIGHMVIAGKLPAGNARLKIRFDFLLLVLDVLLIRLPNIVLKLPINHFRAGVVGHINRLFKEHTWKGGKDHHEKERNDDHSLDYRFSQ